MPPDDPTRTQFGAYSAAYDYYNQALFEGKLPRCMLNFSRKTRRVLGFFALSDGSTAACALTRSA